MCDCPPCPFSPLSPVFAELQQADLITSEEIHSMVDNYDTVFRVQSGKSLEVLSKIADAFRRHGFDEHSNFVLGKQTQRFIHVPVGVVQWSLVVWAT